jgi:hypothetical protein
MGDAFAQHHPLSSAARTTPLSSLTPEQWREDLRSFAAELPKRHANLFHQMKQGDFERAVTVLDSGIPALSADAIFVELARIVAQVGDGHTSVSPFFNRNLGFHRLPVRFYWFKDGLFLIEAAPPFARLVGGRVMRIGAVPAEEALARVGAIVNRDNEMTVRDVAPNWLQVPEVLHGLGMIETATTVPLEVDKQGTRQSAELPALDWQVASDTAGWVNMRDGATSPTPLWLRDPRNPFWFEYLKEHRLLYVQYNVVADKDDEKLKAFFDRVFHVVDVEPVEKLVIDIRRNNGGNGYLNWPLIYHIIRSDKINEKGKLFVIIGRLTFSAATMCAVYLERHTAAIFVGEPTGGSPNGYGEHGEVILPNSRLNIFVSTLYWQESDPRDKRPWIAPRLPAELTSDDFRSNTDPAMKAILEYASGGAW